MFLLFYLCDKHWKLFLIEYLETALLLEVLQSLLFIIYSFASGTWAAEELRKIREACMPQGYSDLFSPLFYTHWGLIAFPFPSWLFSIPSSNLRSLYHCVLRAASCQDSVYCACVIIYRPSVCLTCLRCDLYFQLMQNYILIFSISSCQAHALDWIVTEQISPYLIMLDSPNSELCPIQDRLTADPESLLDM